MPQVGKEDSVTTGKTSAELGYDARSQEWFRTAVSLPKDIFVLIHTSKSVNQSVWQLAVKELRRFCRTLVPLISGFAVL